jgi:hypothetical protein
VALNLGAKSGAPFQEEFHKDPLGGIILLRHAGALFGESRSTAHFTSAIPRSLENRGPSRWPSFPTTRGPTARRPPCRFEHPYDMKDVGLARGEYSGAGMPGRRAAGTRCGVRGVRGPCRSGCSPGSGSIFLPAAIHGQPPGNSRISDNYQDR